ncbi:MAG: DUF423 domain-containing protein [Pyrinomonadaceae bacterium]|nr:DUF423 domain-containing protein [Sphingobacteriaceae bacterium]
MNKQIIITAGFFGLLAVVLGAFGAHALKASLSATDLDTWKTGVSYQFYHTLTLLFLSSFSKYRSRLIIIAFYAFTLGIIFFSGSIYLLSTHNITHISTSIIGPFTPLGGLFLILGWISLILAAIKNK